MSTSSNKSAVGRGGIKNTSQPPSSKALRRDFSLVSPASPDSPMSALNFRTMLQEALDPISNELQAVQRSIKANSTKLDDIKSLSNKCKSLETENILLKQRLEKTENKCQIIEERLILLEARSRRNNLKFLLMKDHKINPDLWRQQECDTLVIVLCKRYGIHIEQSNIELAHRLGNKSQSAPVIVRFLNNKDKTRVLKEKQKFRSDGIIVTEDFPPEIVRRRKMFSPVLTAAYKLPTTYKAFLSFDKLIVNGKSYTHNDLDKLQIEIRPSSNATVSKDKITAFYSCHSKLSNHYACKFTTGGDVFSSVEQYLMYQKAIHFGDRPTAVSIQQTDDPGIAKALGKSIKNFKPDVWKEVREQYMKVGISAKFEQNPELSQYLKET